MKAVVYAGDGKVEVADAGLPHLTDPGDAIVKVSLTAICGSDLHLLDGKTPGMREGGVIGHEFVGVLTELDGASQRHAEGTRVLGSFLIACGECESCRTDRFNFCKNRRALGLGTLTGDLDGAQAEYVRVPNADLNLKLLDGAMSGLSDEKVLFGGDVLATGFYAADLGEVGAGDTVAIVGAGPIGLFTAAAASARGGRVFVLDMDKNRVAFAKSVLKDATALHVGEDDAHKVVAKAAGGVDVDVTFDAVGSIPAFKTAMRIARDGGRVVVIGVYGAERYEFPMGMVWVRGLNLKFSGMTNVHAHWDRALMAVAKEELDPTKLITHRLPLDDAVEGYRLFASREATKVVLTP